jgi:tRNA(adenine34) deaminase
MALLLARGIRVESATTDLAADLARLGVYPGATAVVAATPAEAEAARRAGSVAVGVGADEVALRDACARLVVPNVDALVDRIDEVLDRLSPTEIVVDDAFAKRALGFAIDAARAAMALEQVPIGCAILDRSGTLLTSAFNRQQLDRDKTAHAEIVAFRQIAGRVPMDERGLMVACTLEPCVMCASACMLGGVDTVLFGLRAPCDGGAERVSPPRSPEACVPRFIGDVESDACRELFIEWLSKHPGAPGAPFVRQLLETT